MQLGTRWTSGGEPPASVPADLRTEIAKIDALETAEPRPRWTLTWLEGRPVAELDTGVIVSVAADGSVVVRHDSDTGFADDDEFA